MKIVLVLALFVFSTQNVEGKEISQINNDLAPIFRNHLNLIESKVIAPSNVNRLRSINDLWEKIKNSIATAWNSIKDIAYKTKEKINAWIRDIKKRAAEIAKDFQAKLEVLKKKLDTFIQAVKDAAGDVKQCIQEDRDAIQELLKQIATTVSTCIANSVKKGSVIGSYQARLALDDAEFVKRAEDRINLCAQNLDDAEECLNKARGELYDDMEHTENDIMETRISSRNLADDVLETILGCAAEGINEASKAIIEEVLKVINCVINEKEKPFV